MPSAVLRPGRATRGVRASSSARNLIDAAITLLARLGPEDPFSLRAVAKEAGVAAPSVYLHFADRDPLLLAVLERLFTEVIALRAAAEAQTASAGGGPWEQLLAGCLAMVRFGMERPGHYKALYEGRVVLRLTDPKAAAFGRPLHLHTAGLIRQIAAASAPRPGTPDPDRLALLLWAGMHGVVSLQINKPTLDWPAAEELVTQMAQALIRPG